MLWPLSINSAAPPFIGEPDAAARGHSCLRRSRGHGSTASLARSWHTASLVFFCLLRPGLAAAPRSIGRRPSEP